MLIRPADAADLGAVARLLDELDDLHRQALPWLLQRVEGPPSTAALEPYVTQPDHALFVAVSPDGFVAGALAILLRQPGRSPLVTPTVAAEIDTLVVSRACRRQQVGTRLVEAALAWARAAGATRTELGVYEFNEPARGFWASLGFETLSRRLVLRT